MAPDPWPHTQATRLDGGPRARPRRHPLQHTQAPFTQRLAPPHTPPTPPPVQCARGATSTTHTHPLHHPSTTTKTIIHHQNLLAGQLSLSLTDPATTNQQEEGGRNSSTTNQSKKSHNHAVASNNISFSLSLSLSPSSFINPHQKKKKKRPWCSPPPVSQKSGCPPPPLPLNNNKTSFAEASLATSSSFIPDLFPYSRRHAEDVHRRCIFAYAELDRRGLDDHRAFHFRETRAAPPR